MAPGDWLRAGDNGGIVGVYHSHPGGNVAESNRDRVTGVPWMRWMLVVTVAGEWRVIERDR